MTTNIHKSVAPKLKNVSAVYPLLPMQEGMMFDSLYDRESGAHILQYRWPATTIDPVVTKRAWSAVIERHAALRACFVSAAGDRPLQVIRRQVELPFEVLDWREIPADELSGRLDAFCAGDRRRGFAVSEAPLMRITVVRAGDGDHLVWTFHHLVLDGWSIELVLREVDALGTSFATGQAPPPAAPGSLGDYMKWFVGQDRAQAERFWRDTLAGFNEPTVLWHERRAASKPEMRGFEVRRLVLSSAVSEEVIAGARRHRVTLNTVVQAAFALLLGRYSGRKDVVFGTTVVGRPDDLANAESMVGSFINTVPLRVRLPAREDVGAWLRALQAGQPDLRQFSYVAPAQIQSWSEIEKGTPLFDANLVFQNFPTGTSGAAVAEVDADAATSEIATATDRIGHPLTVIVESAAVISAHFQYDPLCFSAAELERLGRHFEMLLRALAGANAATLADLPRVEEHEAGWLLTLGRGAARPFPADVSLVALFARQVAGCPEATCLEFGDGQMTYRQLDQASERLARRLRAAGVKGEGLVGVALASSCQMIVAYLAALKAGAAYVPIDREYPAERIAFMVADGPLAVVVTDAAGAARLDFAAARVVLVDETDAALPEELAPWPAIAPDSAANVIYTSGSTGTPKGVVVTHRGVARMVMNSDFIGFHSGDRVAQVISPTFDPSTAEIWGALLNGGCLIGVPRELVLSPLELREFLRRERITTYFTTATLFAQLVLQVPDLFATVREVSVGGDVLDPEAVNRAMTAGGPERLWNAYGPTENTVVSTALPLTRGTRVTGRVSIGGAIANSTLYVLDHAGDLLPLGAPGEICVGGPGVARGYLNRPELTATQFVPDPFSDQPGARLYRTGDLGRMRTDGGVEFLGRIDHQVKVRGFRIELGEIESVLRRHPGVRDVAVLVRTGENQQKYIVAYVVGGASSDEGRELGGFVRKHLPDYMVPAAFVALPALPVTRNGKLDRAALPAPTFAAPARTEQAPRSELEATLCSLFAQVLRLPEVGIHDSFFQRGGDSILSIQVVTRAARAGLRLTPKQIFEHRTVAALARVLAETSAVAAVAAPARDVCVEGTFELTPIQRWLFEQQRPGVHHFNQATVLKADRLSPAVLREAVGALLAHHDQLRARFPEQGGRRVQSLPARESEVPFAHVDLGELSADAQVAALGARVAALQTGFDLARGPLVRVEHFDLGAGGSRIAIVAHHLVVDAVSWRIIVEDLEALYTRLEAGQTPDLLPKTTAFASFSQRLATFACTPESLAERRFWSDGAGTAPLPRDRRDGTNTVAAADAITFTLDGAATQALLREVPRAYRTEINDVLLAALAQTLVKFSGQPRVLVDLEGHGREDLASDVDLSRTVGWFTTVFPVALAPEAGGAEPGRVLRTVKETLRAIPRRGIGFGLLRHLHPDAAVREALATLPHAEVSFNYLGQVDSIASSGRFQFSNEPVGALHAPGDQRPHLFALNAHVAGGQLHLDWEYGTEIHERATVEGLVAEFGRQLRALIDHCLQPEAGGCSPSDFPLAGLDQAALDGLLGSERNVEDIYPLAPAQRGMLSHALISGGDLYFEQIHYRTGTPGHPFDLGRYTRAWQTVVDRHPILRTAFRWEGLGEPLQVVQQTLRAPVTYRDLRGLSPEAQQAAVTAYLADDRAAGVSLAAAPLYRIGVLQLRDDCCQVVWSCHHILLDGWSGALLLEEVASELRQTPAAATPRRPFRDYIAWLGEQPHDGAERFFRGMLAGVKGPTPLWFDHAAAGEQTEGHGEVELSLPPDVTASLVVLARKTEVTLGTIVQGAWAALLGRHADRDDVTLGVTLSGRPPQLAGSEEMLGLFINTLPLRVALPPQLSVGEWLQRLQRLTVEMRQHEHTPLAMVQEWSELPPGLRLFESLVVFENYQTGDAAPGDDGESGFAGARTNYPLTLLACPGEALGLHLVYQRRCFTRASAERFLGHLGTLLAAIAFSESRPLGELPLLTPAELVNVVEHNERRELLSDDFLAGLLAAPPAGLALRLGARCLGFGELQGRVTATAQRLRASGDAGAVAVNAVDPVERFVKALAAVAAGRSFALLPAGADGAALPPAIDRDTIGRFLHTLATTVKVGPADQLLGTAAPLGGPSELLQVLALACGARLHLLDAEEVEDKGRVRVSGEGKSLFALPAEAIRALLEDGWEGPRDARVLGTGEALPTEFVMQFCDLGVAVWQLDLATPWPLWARAADAEYTRGVRYVGAPVVNGGALVLDRHGRLMPAGTVGHLHLGGADARVAAVPDLKAWKSTGARARVLPAGEIELIHELALARLSLRPRPPLPTPFVPPRNQMELRLALILEELLQLHPIGVRDDFFTLGGNSLLAIHLVARLAREFGVELTLGTLVEASRIETLARLLVDRDGIPAANGAVKLQAGGHLRPFFFVHPIGGNVLCYVELARLLGEEQPVYGLEPSASGEGPGQPNGIPGMAADYVRTVRRLQPQGPYFLGGLSFGGFVAYEMAQQLRREGEEVAVLALLDTWAPHRDDDDEAAQELVDGKIIWGLASDFAHTYGKELSLAVEELVGLPLEEQMDRVLEDMRVTGLLPNSGELSQMRRSLDWYRSNTRALRAYVPAPYAGTITLLRAGELDLRQHYIRNHPLRHDPTRGWSVLSSQPVQAHEVPGTHTTMIMDPLHLRTLAARLRGILERAHAAVEGCSPGAAVARTD